MHQQQQQQPAAAADREGKGRVANARPSIPSNPCDAEVSWVLAERWHRNETPKTDVYAAYTYCGCLYMPLPSTVLRNPPPCHRPAYALSQLREGDGRVQHSTHHLSLEGGHGLPLGEKGPNALRHIGQSTDRRPPPNVPLPHCPPHPSIHPSISIRLSTPTSTIHLLTFASASSSIKKTNSSSNSSTGDSEML